MADNSCLTCRFAQWERTKAGRLHPSGDGRCQWQMPEIIIPRSFYWFSAGIPKPSGGFIDRRSPHTDCPCFEARDD